MIDKVSQFFLPTKLPDKDLLCTMQKRSDFVVW